MHPCIRNLISHDIVCTIEKKKVLKKVLGSTCYVETPVTYDCLIIISTWQCVAMFCFEDSLFILSGVTLKHSH